MLRAGNPLRHSSRLRAAVCVAVASASTSCALPRVAPEPVVSTLIVRNEGYFDVNIYAIAGDVAMPKRLTTVIGNTSARIPLFKRYLQPDGSLMVRVKVVSAASSWTSDAVAQADGLVFMLDVNTSSNGDCSSMTGLRTITASMAQTLIR